MRLTKREKESQERLKCAKPSVYAKVLHYPEKFAHGESIAALDVQYSFACNFHCVHCSISGMRTVKRERITPADIKNLCDQGDALGLAHFCLTGGEPLIFPDLEEVLTAVGPDRYYVQIDTNGWYLDMAKARWLKAHGVDKIQLSIDGLNSADHDEFRKCPGSHARALQAAEAVKAAGMSLQIATVVTHERVNSLEYEAFLDFADNMGAVVAVQMPKLVGEWQGRTDLLLTESDMARLRKLGKLHRMTTHVDGGYGMLGGCLAARRLITINAWGDLTPCAGMRFVLGNIRTTPLVDMLKKGMRYFGGDCPTCRIQDPKFPVAETPVSIEDVFPFPYGFTVEDMA